MPLSRKQISQRKPRVYFASDLPGLFPEYAASYNKSILELYAEHTGIGPLRKFSGNASTDAGDFLEKPIAQMWARDKKLAGEPVQIKKVRESRVVSMSGLQLGATPDFIAEKNLVKDPWRHAVECKYVNPMLEYQWEDDAPFHVLLQVSQQTLVWKFESVAIAAWIGSAANRRAYSYTPNQELEQNVVERWKWFDEIVAKRLWHERLPDTEEISEEIKKRFLIKIFPGTNAPDIAATDSDLQLFELWKSAKLAADTAQKEMERIANLALQRMGNAGKVIGPDGKALWRKVKKDGYEVKAHTVSASTFVQLVTPRNKKEVYEKE